MTYQNPGMPPKPLPGGPQIGGGGPLNTGDPNNQITMPKFPTQIGGGGVLPGGPGSSFGGPTPQGNSQYGQTVTQQGSGVNPLLGGPQISGGGPVNTGGGNPATAPRPLQPPPDPTWQAGKTAWDAQTAAGMTPADRAKAAGDPNWAMYGATSPANSAATGNTNPLTNPQVSGGGPPNTGNPNPAAPGNPYAQFTSTNNLIGSQITTNPSTRTLGAQDATDTAKSNYTNYQFQPFNAQSPVDTSRTQGLLEQGNSQVQSQQGFNYTPVAGTDLSGAQKYLSQAGASIGPSAAASGLMGQGQTGGFGYSGDTQGLRGTTMSQLDKTLNNTPDRGQLASDAYNLLLERSAPQQQAEDRGLAQKTAALGRVGSGMFNSEQMDLATSRERERDMARRDLANNAAGLSLQDQMDKLNASRGVTSDFSGYDLGAGNLNLGYQNSNNAERGNAFDRSRALGNDTFNQNLAASSQSANLAGVARGDALEERDALRTSGLDNNNVLANKAASNRTLGSDLYGMDSDAYNRATGERDAGLNYDQNIFRNRQNIFADAGNDEQRLLGNDRYNADEMRGERGYQYGLERDAQGDRRQQTMDQDYLLNSRFGRGQGLTSAGYANDPTGVLGQQAQGYGQAASDSYGSAGDLFGNYALNRQINPNATAPRPLAGS